MTLQDMLERDEGRRHVAYADSLGFWTIGVGHHDASVVEGLVWDDDLIDDTLQLDINAATQACLDHFSPWFSALNDARQAVLIAMVFQLGIGGVLKFVNTLANIRDQHFANAAEGMRQSVWGQQTPQRVNRMALQMESGAWQ